MAFTVIFPILLICNAWSAVSRAHPGLSARAPQVRQEALLEDKLDRDLDQFETSGRNLTTLLLDLAYEYKIPLAFEYVDKAATTEPINMFFKHQPVRAIIEAAVAKFPQYRVSFSAGLVDIYAPSARADRSNILNILIKDFTVTGVDTHRAHLELFCAVVRQTQKDAVCAGSTATGQWGTKKITLHMENAKVYEILNAIVAQNGEAAWTVLVPLKDLSKRPFPDPWHIYPLEKPYESAVLDKLSSIRSN